MKKFEWKVQTVSKAIEEGGYHLHVDGVKSKIFTGVEILKKLPENFSEGLNKIRIKLTENNIVDREQNKCIIEFVKTWHRTRHSLSNIILDMIRRIIPSTIANEIVGIQPMSAPTGQIFSVRPKYAHNKTAKKP